MFLNFDAVRRPWYNVNGTTGSKVILVVVVVKHSKQRVPLALKAAVNFQTLHKGCRLGIFDYYVFYTS